MYEKIRKFDADILRKIKVSEKIANSLFNNLRISLQIYNYMAERLLALASC